MVFAVLVTFVHCYYGYNATGGPAGVGVAAGRAIRLSIILVVVVNLFMSLILFGGRQRHGEAGRMRRLCNVVVSLVVLFGLVFGTVELVRMANGDFAGRLQAERDLPPAPARACTPAPPSSSAASRSDGSRRSTCTRTRRKVTLLIDPSFKVPASSTATIQPVNLFGAEQVSISSPDQNSDAGPYLAAGGDVRPRRSAATSWATCSPPRPRC